jgi:hypothetical protein
MEAPWRRPGHTHRSGKGTKLYTVRNPSDSAFDAVRHMVSCADTLGRWNPTIMCGARASITSWTPTKPASRITWSNRLPGTPRGGCWSTIRTWLSAKKAALARFGESARPRRSRPPSEGHGPASDHRSSRYASSCKGHGTVHCPDVVPRRRSLRYVVASACSERWQQRPFRMRAKASISVGSVEIDITLSPACPLEYDPIAARVRSCSLRVS